MDFAKGKELFEEIPKSVIKGNWVTPDKSEAEDFSNQVDEENLPKVALALKAIQFTDNVTMHGMRYIFMKDMGSLRRLLWILVVLSGMAYCVYIIQKSLSNYNTFPTITKVTKNYERISEFPAVTICSYNVFQKSKLSPSELEILHYIYGDYYYSDEEESSGLSPLTVYDEINVTQFYYDKAFDYERDFCTYKRRICSKSMRSRTLTDHGVCLTIDPSNDPKQKYQTTPGPNGGLFWADVLNFEDWTYGPYFVVKGFRVAIHEPGTKIYSLQQKGFSLQSSLTMELSLKRTKDILQSPPYGVCGSVPLQTSSEYSNEKCLLECRTNYTINKCGCKDVYMPGPAKVCSFEQQYNCTMDILEPLEESDLFDASSCTCPKDCERIEYDVDVTYTEPSDDYLDMLQRWFSSEPVTERYGLRVFYNEFEYIESTQEAIYDLERLLCDIGGAAGLFLGCSFVTFFEFIDFVTEFVWLWSLKRVNVRRKKQKKEANTLT